MDSYTKGECPPPPRLNLIRLDHPFDPLSDGPDLLVTGSSQTPAFRMIAAARFAIATLIKSYGHH